MREIVFDTETTGLSFSGGDRLVEIGCVEMINRVETGRSFHAYCNPGIPMPAKAQEIHGLTDIFLSDKPRFPAIVDDFLDFIGDAPLVAHNASFDFGFLNGELAACQRTPVAIDRMVDTLAIAKVRHPGSKLSLDALCTRYGIDRSQRLFHGALMDAQLLAQVYVELTGGRQIGLELIDQPEDERESGGSFAPSRVRPPRPFAVSADERARHAAFVAKINGSLWDEAPAG